MDVSAEQDDEIWFNQAFRIPTVPKNRRDHYPFSKDPAIIYRLKLAAFLLNAVVLLCVVEPCERLAVLLTGWLLFVTFEHVYKNYPWREPINIWFWKLYFAIPYSGALFSICCLLLLLFLLYVGEGCEMPHPFVEMIVIWISGMMLWPVVRERWHREERSEYDYDQFSYTRPYVLTLSGPFRIFFAALHSPSLLALAAAFAVTSLVALCLSGWIADLWAVSTGVLLLACLAILCCHQLPEDVARTLAAWEVEEAAHARRIENCLRVVKGNLRTSGYPSEGSSRFDRLAIQVPLLMREAKILRNASRTITESKIEELKKLTTAKEVVEFRRMCDNYGPYTTECCIS